MATQQPGSVTKSAAHVTTKSHADVSGLLPGTILLSKDCAKLAPPLTAYSTWESSSTPPLAAHYSHFRVRGPEDERRRAGSTPCLSCVVAEKEEVPFPHPSPLPWQAGERVPAPCSLGHLNELSRAVLVKASWRRCKGALSDGPTAQSRSRALGWPTPISTSSMNCPSSKKGLSLQILSCRIFKTQVTSYRRRILITDSVTEASNQANY